MHLLHLPAIACLSLILSDSVMKKVHRAGHAQLGKLTVNTLNQIDRVHQSPPITNIEHQTPLK